MSAWERTEFCIVEGCGRAGTHRVGSPEGAPVCGDHQRQWLALPKEMRATPHRTNDAWRARHMDLEAVLGAINTMEKELTRLARHVRAAFGNGE